MDLPQEVVSEIRANRKIQAIKLLRESQGIGLKDAKEVVEAYMEHHRDELPPPPERPRSSGFWVFIVLLVGLVYSLYTYYA
jgi:Ribosomal protein L7/L12 C-terminal domain